MAFNITAFSGTENTTDGATNTSSVTWSWTLQTTNGSYDHTGKAWYRVYTSDSSYDSGKIYFNPGKSSGTSTKSYVGTTGSFAHNSDGSLASKQFNLQFYETANKQTHTSAYTQYFTTYARYATITAFSVSKRDETSVTVNWNANANCDIVQYSIDNGANWTTTSGTTFVISGLTANTYYNFKIQVRRQDSGLWTQSGTYGQSTYAYPYISSAPNFTIGNTTTLGIYNPLGRSCDLYILNPLEQDNSKSLGTITGQTIDIPNTQEWQTFFYNGIPNSASGLYRVRLVCSEVSRDTTVNGGTYSVNPNINKPDVSNMLASYTADLTNLTNDNQTVINGASTITYTITSGATALNGASISKYIVNWGNASDEITDIQNSATLVKGSGNTISVTIQDSRGITNTYSTSISEVITYTSPTQLSISPDRLNGVGENVYLDVSGIIYYDKFGANGVSNGITSITYSITGETAQDEPVLLSSLSYSEQSSTTHTQKFSIVDAPIDIDGQGGGFDTSKTYEVTVYVTDKSGTTVSIKGTIKDGKFAMIKGRDSNGDYHTGINGLPDNDYALKVHGNIGADNLLSPLDIYPVGSIYMSVNSTDPSTLFGGTWQRIQDTFLLCAGSTYSAGSTGGSSSVTLNENQIPGHRHILTPSNFHQDYNFINAGTADTGGSWNADNQFALAVGRKQPSTTFPSVLNSSNLMQTLYTNYAGGGQSHENMPPYLSVYCWQRVS